MSQPSEKETIEAAIRAIFERFSQTEKTNQCDFRDEEADIQVVIRIEEIKPRYSERFKTILSCIISGGGVKSLDERSVALYYKIGDQAHFSDIGHLHYEYGEGLHLVIGGGRGIRVSGPYKLALESEAKPQIYGPPEDFWNDNPIYDSDLGTLGGPAG